MNDTDRGFVDGMGHTIDVEDYGVVHVMAPREQSDVMLAEDEFTCSSEWPWGEDEYPEIRVVFHPDTEAIGDTFVCPNCGEAMTLGCGLNH